MLPGMALRSHALTALSFSILTFVAQSCGGDTAATASPPDGDGGPTGADGGTTPAPDGGGSLPDGSSPDGAVTTGPCAGKTGAPGSRTVTLMSGGQSRAFDLHVPAKYDPAKRTPLVFLFHGFTMTPSQIATASHFADVADARGMIVAFPSGTSNSFNAGNCCGAAASSNVDDVGFTRDMIASLDAQYCVDAKRVFSTGFSNGGYMSYRLACELSDKIAAIAPVSGILGLDPCTPKRPVPVLHIHGTSDPLVPFSTVSASIDAFKAKNTCAAGAGMVVYEKGDVSCTKWGPCAANADVELCTVTGGGHQWPGGDTLPYGGTPTMNLIASTAIADFFDAHPMP